MQLHDSLKAKIMDIRLRDKLLSEGKITLEEVQKYLDALPDESERAQVIDLPQQ